MAGLTRENVADIAAMGFDLQDALSALHFSAADFLKGKGGASGLSLGMALYITKTETFARAQRMRSDDSPLCFFIQCLVSPRVKGAWNFRPVALVTQMAPYSTDDILVVSRRVLDLDAGKNYIPAPPVAQFPPIKR